MHKILQSVYTFDYTTNKLDNNRFIFFCIAKKMIQLLQLKRLTALAKLDHKAEGHSNNKEFSNKKKVENISVGAIPTDINLQLE